MKRYSHPEITGFAPVQADQHSLFVPAALEDPVSAKTFAQLDKFIMKLIRITQKSTSRFVAKTSLSLATTLLLLLSVRSSVFAGSATWKLNSIVGDGNTATSLSFGTSRFAGTNTPLDDPIFTDTTVSAGLNGMGVSFVSVLWGDLDIDGGLDVFVVGYYE